MKSKTPKPLHKICGKEMIRMILDSCESAGLPQSITIVPDNFDNFEKVTLNRTKYVTQKKANGSGDALLQITKLPMPDNIIVLNSDVPLITDSTISKMITSHIKSDAYITLLTSIQSENKGLGRIPRVLGERIHKLNAT